MKEILMTEVAKNLSIKFASHLGELPSRKYNPDTFLALPSANPFLSFPMLLKGKGHDVGDLSLSKTYNDYVIYSLNN